MPDLTIKEDKLYKRTRCNRSEELDPFPWKLWIPEELTYELIRKAHDNVTAARGGISKTIHRLREKYYWPKMTLQMKQYINNCVKCK